MKLFDTVKLLNDYNELPAGTEGTNVRAPDGPPEFEAPKRDLRGFAFPKSP